MAKNARKPEAVLRAARKYVDQQLATMKKYGTFRKQLTDQEYQALVSQIVEATVK